MRSLASDARPLFLVGMMGAGKSSVGVRLAARLGRGFVDLDRAIEARAGTSIAAMFTGGREAEFRALEAAALRELGGPDQIVATGGGAVARVDNLEHMLAAGTVVYLRARIETLVARLATSAASDRPLLDDGADRSTTLETLLAARHAAYERASLAVDTDGRSIDEVLDATLRALAGGA